MKQTIYVATMSYTYENRELNSADMGEYAYAFLDIDEAKRHCIENIVAGWSMYLFDLSTNLSKFPNIEKYVNSHRDRSSPLESRNRFNYLTDNSDLVSAVCADTTYDLSDLCSLINMSPANNLGLNDNSFKDMCYASIHTIKLAVDSNVREVEVDVDIQRT